MTTIKAIFAITAMAFSLGACASKPPLPIITYDNNDFLAAFEAPPTKRPVQIITIPEPLPLPGQLKPRPSSTDQAAEENANPRKRVANANDAARVEPSNSNYLNAVQVYPFTDGALYQLYAAPGKVSDVALQPGEQLIAVSAGDTVRWVIGNTTSGAGGSEQVHIFIKPIRSGLRSNLVITTDKRTYHVEMTSDALTYMASLSWHYPFDELVALQNINARAEAQEAEIVDTGLDIRKLRFRYSISEVEAPWRPLRVFDDGTRVYIQFPRGIIQGEAPPLFVVGRKGDAQLVNYRMRGNYYIVDRLFAAAELRLGEEPQAIVRITRIDGDPS